MTDLTRRDRFALAAMQALVQRNGALHTTGDAAVALADAMLVALDGTPDAVDERPCPCGHPFMSRCPAPVAPPAEAAPAVDREGLDRYALASAAHQAYIAGGWSAVVNAILAHLPAPADECRAALERLCEVAQNQVRERRQSLTPEFFAAVEQAERYLKGAR